MTILAILAAHVLHLKFPSVFSSLYERFSRKVCQPNVNLFSCQENIWQFRSLPLLAMCGPDLKKALLDPSGRLSLDSLPANGNGQLRFCAPAPAWPMQPSPVHCFWCPALVLWAVEHVTSTDTDISGRGRDL